MLQLKKKIVDSPAWGEIGANQFNRKLATPSTVLISWKQKSQLETASIKGHFQGQRALKFNYNVL